MADIQNPIAKHSWNEVETAINDALSKLSGLNVTVGIRSVSLKEPNGSDVFLGRSAVAEIALTLQANDPNHDIDSLL